MNGWNLGAETVSTTKVPQYPDGPQYYDVDYRRTLYWNPNLKTDKDGHAGIEFYNNSYSLRFKVSASGLNGGVPYSMDK